MSYVSGIRKSCRTCITLVQNAQKWKQLISQIIYINAGEIIMNADDIGDGDSLNDNINIMIDLGKGYSRRKGAVSVHRVWCGPCSLIWGETISVNQRWQSFYTC